MKSVQEFIDKIGDQMLELQDLMPELEKKQGLDFTGEYRAAREQIFIKATELSVWARIAFDFHEKIKKQLEALNEKEI